MISENFLLTDRLLINPLSEDDCEFMLELLNTDGWKSFIGNRNINSPADAAAYIRKIIDNPDTNCRTVRLKNTNTSIGIITFIKRDYLEHHDIGFAFLPEYFNKGYAFEATNAVLKFITQFGGHSHILATTVPENRSSVKLLKNSG